MTLAAAALYLVTEAQLWTAVELAPGDKNAWVDLGVYLAENGAADRAEAPIAMALALDPSDGESWAFLGRLERRLGDRDRGTRFLQHATAVDPRSSAHHDLGDIALAAGDPATAEREYGADLAVEPSCPEARANRAALLIQRGEAQRAAVEYVTALAFHPDDAAARAGLDRALAVRPRRQPWLLYIAGGATALALAAALVRMRKPRPG